MGMRSVLLLTLAALALLWYVWTNVLWTLQ
jgi:hypothetical protein